MLDRRTRSRLLPANRGHRLVLLLATVGLGFASYLTYLYYGDAEAVFCQLGSGCDIVRAVSTSRY